MAKPTTASAAKMTVWLGNDASPQVYSRPCGLTTNGINFSKETNDVSVPDCDDPDAPAWLERVARSFSAGISGSGVLAKEALSAWQDFFLATEAKDLRVVIDGVGWGRWDGSFHMTTFNVTAELGNKIQVEIALVSDGPVAWTTVP